MCTIKGVTNRRIGYKVLAMKDNKFYSTFTGQEIKIGKVPKAPEYGERMSAKWTDQSSSTVLFKHTIFYLKKYNGKTAAFINKGDATDMRDSVIYKMLSEYLNYKIVIVKVTFTGIVFIGYYLGEIIAGTNIKSMKLIKTI